MLAIDNHGAALQHTRALAEACGVDAVSRSICASHLGSRVHSGSRTVQSLFSMAAAFSLCSARSLELLAPGGLVVYSHFMDPLEGRRWRHHSNRVVDYSAAEMRPSPASGFDVLRDEAECY